MNELVRPYKIFWDIIVKFWLIEILGGLLES